MQFKPFDNSLCMILIFQVTNVVILEPQPAVSTVQHYMEINLASLDVSGT